MRYDHFSMLPEKAFQPRNGCYGMTLEGGGGGQPSQPTQTSQITIPEYAKPYMERLIGKGEALTSAPYQTYGGERISEATPGQLAAREGVAGLQQPGQFGAGTGLVGAGGLNALAAGQNYFGMATSPGVQQAFMSPYMQNVLDVQKAEAIRDAQKGQLAQNLAAARQGTYGGARQLLAGTERERNLGQQLANIQATGLQNAYDQAIRSMQFGTTAGLQGAQAATQAGLGLGQLGTQQQAADLQRLQAQEQFAGLGRAEEQAKLDLAYQDFLAQQQYPYKQLGFMSDLLRGSSNLAATGGKTVYEQPPSLAGQLLGLGGTALGAYMGTTGKNPLSGLFREGGEVKGYAEGGEVKGYAGGGLPSIIENAKDVEQLTPDQIEGMRASGARPDVPDLILLAELDKKLAQIQQAKGQSGIPQTTAVEDIRNQASQEMAGLNAIPIPDDYYRSEEEVANMAGGGIVAFANGGEAQDYAGGVSYDDGSVGYPIGGLIAPFLNVVRSAGPAVMSRLGMADKAILGTVGAAGRGAVSLTKGAVKNPLTTGLAGYGAYEYMTNEPGEEKPKEEAKAPEAVEPPKPAKKDEAKDKAPVSKQAVARVQKAEDAYEKALRQELDKTDLSEEDKVKALGFSLMKFGAKAMQARRGKEGEKIGEGVESAVNDYVNTLQQAKKDKRQLTKDLAEYGLAKEKNRILEQSSQAQLAQAEAAMVRAERTGTQAEQAAARSERASLIKAWQEQMKVTAPKDRLPFPIWLQTEGFAGAPAGAAAPSGDIRQFYKR